MPEQKPTWCWFSTHESIQNEVPSVTAILETIIAVPVYWWLALRVGVILPLLVSAAVAPLVLLRSDQSVALGVKWFLRWENTPHVNRKYLDLEATQKAVVWAIAGALAVASLTCAFLIVSYFPTGTSNWVEMLQTMCLLFVLSLVIFLFLSGMLRQFSSLLPYFKYLEDLLFLTFDRVIHRNLGFALFVLVFFFGYAVGVPIVVVLLAIATRVGATLIYLHHGVAALPRNFRRLALCTSPAQIPELVPGLNATKSRFTFREWFDPMVVPVLIFFFLPPWLYRITIKSTAWFWWPLAFLGGDLRRVQNPEHFHWKVMGSLWAKTSIVLACLSLLAFAAANFIFDGTVFFERNPLLTPVGYLLLIDWKLRLWQVCALSAAVLSIVIVYLANDVNGEYGIAQSTGDGKLLAAAKDKYGSIERLTRVRFLVLLAFWGLVGTHAGLYANSQQCWFSLSPELQEWAEGIYGDRLPRFNKCLPLPINP